MSCKFGFVFDPLLHDLQLLYLNSIEHCILVFYGELIPSPMFNEISPPSKVCLK